MEEGELDRFYLQLIADFSGRILVRRMNALFVGSIIFYVVSTVCGLAIWAYSSFRTRLSFAYVFLASYAVALPLFSMHLVLTLDPQITFVLLGPHGPQLWGYIFMFVQAVAVLLSLIGLILLVRWIHRQVLPRDA